MENFPVISQKDAYASCIAVLAKRARKMRKEEPEKHKDVYAALEQADFRYVLS